LARLGFGPASRRAKARERLRVVHALSALAAELVAGQPAAAALVASAGIPSAWPLATAAAELGDDVVSALHADAFDRPVLRSLAACWQVSSDTGTGLAAAVASLADAVRSAEDVRVQLAAELAGPRATARTLAVLPVAGLGFGTLLGGDPLGWLLGTSPGLACLTIGGALTGLGYAWTARIATRVESML
jgi:tight adherence protein B